MRVNLGIKLVISHLGMGIIPLLLISWLLWITSSNSLEMVTQQGISAVEDAAHDQLKTMCQLKENQILSFFKGMVGQLHSVTNNPWTLQVINSLNRTFIESDSATDFTAWQNLVRNHDALFLEFCTSFEWQDIFLINSQGDIVYSLGKGSELGLSLHRSPLRQSSLGQAFAHLQTDTTLEIAFGDYAPYVPLRNAPAAFLVIRIKDAKQEAVYIAVQISAAAIKSMMRTASNKKNALEAYLVGSDGYMRSDSVLNPEDYSIAASFRLGNQVNTKASRDALNGETGAGLITDYLGNRVLSSWMLIDIFTTRWALICDIHEA
ncbi:MAG: hypothetical protein D3923_14220, partial [Candidatus Electrothrix sp. AR3]|nr:hypothetical protein [Candidatus Electrothrix sp. AR3]